MTLNLGRERIYRFSKQMKLLNVLPWYTSIVGKRLKVVASNPCWLNAQCFSDNKLECDSTG